jgi:hypothetical protein
MRAPRLTFIGLAALLGGCLELPDFESGSIVKGPRVLAVVAEPPEIRPGETLDLSILIAGVEDPSQTEITWRACGSFDGFFGGGGAQYGEEQADEGCGAGLAFELGEGPTAQLPGVLTASLFDNLDVIAMTLGSDLPEGIIDEIRSSVGIAFLVEATVRTEGKLIRATKRVLLSENDDPHTNPPPPQLMFARDQPVIAQPDEPLRCAGEGGEPVTAEPGVAVELAPFMGALVAGEDGAPDEEPWLETYNILNARGELRERQERAFYAWYATAGELESGSTKSPLRNNVWRTPSEPGDYPLWLIIRDGHGGTSACQLTVTVD